MSPCITFVFKNFKLCSITCDFQTGKVTLVEVSDSLFKQDKNEKSLVNGVRLAIPLTTPLLQNVASTMFDREKRRTKILEARVRTRRDNRGKSAHGEVSSNLSVDNIHGYSLDCSVERAKG